MEGFEADNDRDYTPFSQSDDDSLLTDGKWVRGKTCGRMRERDGQEHVEAHLSQ